MVSIKTDRILLPKKIVYNTDNIMIGYLTNYIDNVPISNISSFNISDFCKEIFLMYKDSIILARNHIETADLSRENTVYGDGIYLIDPGSYEEVHKSSVSDIVFKNTDKLNNYVIEDLIEPEAYKFTSKKKVLSVINDIYQSDQFVAKYIRDDMINDETLGNYVKRKVNKKVF